jgi:hypothetical protein
MSDPWERKLAACYALVVVIIALGLAFCTKKAEGAEVPKFTLSSPICPNGFWIAQRYDTRDKRGVITNAVWITRCAKTPRIIYAAH